MLVFGGLVGLEGLWTVLTGTVGIAPLLKAIGGLSLVAIAVHQLGVADNPVESVPGPWGVRMTTLGAALMAGGYLLQVAA